MLLYCISGVYEVTGAGSPSPPSYSTSLETQLRTQLYTGYEVLQRPQQTVATNIQLNLLTINYLVIHSIEPVYLHVHYF